MIAIGTVLVLVPIACASEGEAAPGQTPALVVSPTQTLASASTGLSSRPIPQISTELAFPNLELDTLGNNDLAFAR